LEGGRSLSLKKKVVVFDDESQLRQEWADKLNGLEAFAELFETHVMKEDELRDALTVLRGRRLRAAEGDRETKIARTALDDAAALVVDYDLLSLDETGEEVAYLARCFSTCGIIIAVNQFARDHCIFDLTLQGHPDSYADLNLLSEQLADPGLWGVPWSGFRPWYWPLVPREVDRYERRVVAVERILDDKILDFMGFRAEIREILSPAVLKFIRSEGATFRDFVEHSGQGLRGRREKAASENAIARIAAARIAKWLERLVLPGQNILIDAPHLLERYPSLFMGGQPADLVRWPRVHELLAPDQSVMDLEKITKARFVNTDWLSRATWFWPIVSANEAISEVRDPWTPRVSLAFCEDTSSFLDRQADNPVEFVARVESPFVRRFVSQQGQDYGPPLQFAV
jgi:hypothetical protein